ncbi:PTS sugar transporter subunit IIA [Clostridium sp. KNHs216]|uniref:PTS sugar transporter subunit IIA n=1 Tax=Eubacteriales TaxID=186802 RepID=UPI0011539F5E|nr:PTS sugar transporter subunit IIA [Clostridium sp. KNHs216]MBE6831110.1 PTS sugar transporter subunit IIA [Oscillospiraceae bacterium]TQI68472.1 PTS system galactitol-specific IIA component [Clostridium sp. KNHs216]
MKKEASGIGALLDERLIVLDADVNSDEECIRLMATRFEEAGYVSPGYGDAVIEREKTLPTGLPGKKINLAIPHTNNKLVNKPAVGVIIPKKPVAFHMMGDRETSLDCEVILPLVVKDSKQQIGMLKKIMKIIQNSELLEKLKNSGSKAEIMDCLSSLEDES